MITSSFRGKTLLLNFEDKDSRNAFSIRAARELAQLISQSFAGSASDADSLVFTASGRVFCSGGNLSDYARGSADEGRAINFEIRAALDQLAALSVPTAIAVTGDTFGGGVELLSCFDYAVSVPHAFFGLWQRRIGLTYGWGGGPRIESRIGVAGARALALSADTFSAQEALAYGLVDSLSLDPLSTALSWVTRDLPLEPVSVFKNGSDSSGDSDRNSGVNSAANFNAGFDKLWWNESHQRVLSSRKR